MPYETYQRVNLRSSAVTAVYNVLSIITFLVIPLLTIRHHGHLQVIRPSSVRFLSTVRPDDAASHAALLKEEHARCTALASSRDDAECEYWDWLSIVDSTQHSIFIKTHIQDVLEGKIRGEPLAEYAPLPNVTRSRYTVAPQHTRISIRHRMRVDVRRPSKPTWWAVIDQQRCASVLQGHMIDLQSINFTFSEGNDILPAQALVSSAGVAVEDYLLSGLHLDVVQYHTNAFGRVRPKEHSFREWLVSWGLLDGDDVIFTCARATAPRALHFYTTDVDEIMRQRAVGAVPDIHQYSLRQVRYVRGIDMHFYTDGKIIMPSMSSTLNYIVGSAAILSIPFTVVEMIISLVPRLTRKVHAKLD